MIISKEFSTKHTAETPTNADLEAIRQYALREVTAEEVFTGKMALANDQVDRSWERFPVSYLQRMADTLPGKPVLTGHRDDQTPVGKFYSADVVPRANGSGNDLIARYYVRADNPLVKDIELGIASGVSIRARADKRACGICAKDWDGPSKDRCNHQVGQDYNGQKCHLEWAGDPSKVESLEGSFVPMPCQYDAQALARSLPAGYIAKSGAPGGAQILEYDAANTAPQGDAMDLQQALEKIASLETEIATLKKSHEDDPLVAAGKEYLDFLKSETLRMAGSVSDADKAEREALLATVQTPNLTLIKTIHGGAQKRFDEKFPPKPDGQQRDPNQPPGDKPANFVRRGERIGGMV